MPRNEKSYLLTWFKKLKAVNLLGGKCVTCGEQRPWLLGFHHEDPSLKEFGFNIKKEYRWSLIEIEIKKCRLVCYNCHKEEHHIDGSTKSQINKILCLDYKKIKKCEICGYDRCLEALEFHHTREKKSIIGDTINNMGARRSVDGLPIRLKKELDKCSVLCANCHHDQHFDKDRFFKNRPKILHIKHPP